MMESCLGGMCLKVIRYLKCHKIVPSVIEYVFLLFFQGYAFLPGLAIAVAGALL